MSSQHHSAAGRDHSDPLAAASSPASKPSSTGNAGESASANGLKRKRPGPSSRGVANLTPEQLERKRANDREAQRAIRERTKNQIENLNREIESLKSQQPYLDLQGALRQKEATKAENDELKRRIFSFITSIQPFLTGDAPPQGLEELAAAAERNAINLEQSSTTPQIIQESPYPPPTLQDISSPGGAITASSPGSHASLARHPAPVGSGTSVRSWTSPTESNIRSIHPDLAYNHYDERLGVDFILDNRTKFANGMGPTNPFDGLSPYTVLPRNVPPTCLLDQILLSHRSEHYRLFQTGRPSSEVSGPPYPNFNHLLYADTAIPSHPLSKVMTDILRTFPDLDKLPQQVAVMYVMYLVIRWHVEPTRANYELIPEWITPRPAQLFTAHPHWLDYLPFPRLRDACVMQTPHVLFENFFVPYTTTLSLGWPYDPADVLIPRPPANFASLDHPPPDEPVYHINPAFETHLRKLDNWSLGQAFAEAFPEWASLVKIRER